MQLFQYSVLLFGVTQAVTLQNAEDGFDALQQWYNQSIGEMQRLRYDLGHSDCDQIINGISQAFGSLRQDGGTVPIVTPPNHSLKPPITNNPKGLTVIADFATIDDYVKEQALPVFENTLIEAQKYNLQMQKVVQGNYKPQSYYASAAAGGGPSPFPQGMPVPQGHRASGFLNDYYDDEGWWVLAW